MTAPAVSIEANFKAWITALDAHGVAATALTRPGATQIEIARFEAYVGARLPDEVCALYALSNGQIDPFKFGSVPSGKVITPLFGGYEFLPLEAAAMRWTSWKEIIDQSTPEELDDFDRHAEVGDGEPVRKHYAFLAWIPFANDGAGNDLAIDLDPAPGGTRGQVIVTGRDEPRRVLAPSMTVFLLQLTRMLEAGALTIPPRKDDDKAIVFFDIEGRDRNLQ